MGSWVIEAKAESKMTPRSRLGFDSAAPYAEGIRYPNEERERL
jgi:hypothetical protein